MPLELEFGIVSVVASFPAMPGEQVPAGVRRRRRPARSVDGYAGFSLEGCELHADADDGQVQFLGDRRDRAESLECASSCRRRGSIIVTSL